MHYIFTYYIAGVCNFSCSYCHQNETLIYGDNPLDKRKLRKMGAMDSSSFGASLDIIEKCLEDSTVTINLFGGETFLYKDILLFLIDGLGKIKNSGELRVNISTNGSIYDREVLNLLSKIDFKAVKIDISWHIIEHPGFTPVIEKFCRDIRNEYPKFGVSSTFVLTSLLAGNPEKVIKTLMVIYKTMKRDGITVNFDIGKYWKRKELGDLYNLLKRISQLGLEKRFNLHFDTLQCPELKENIVSTFFLPNGDVFICPYMFITDTDFEKYETHRVGNFLQDSQDEIFHKITNNKTYYLFCKTCLQEQKECFYLDDGVTMLNAIVREFFPSLD